MPGKDTQPSEKNETKPCLSKKIGNVENAEEKDKDQNQDQDKASGTTTREITTKEAYFASLNAWVKHANISQNAMALFPWYLLSSYPQMFQNQAGVSQIGTAPIVPPRTVLNSQQVPNIGVNRNANRNIAFGVVGANAGGLGSAFRILDDVAQAELINRTGGYEYVIAPFWKRAGAEMIDVLILLLLKIMITFTVMNLFDLDLGFDLDKEVLRKAIDDDDYTSFVAVSLDFLAFSSDLLMLEVLTKVIVCFYEAIWTVMCNGATPGKAIMNLRIQYVEAVLPLPPPVPPQPQPALGIQAQRVQIRALLFPAETPNFKRALMRAIAKNLIMTLLFPMCFIMIFFKNNRTVYDIITKTVVVESNPNPVLRQR